MTAIGRFIPAKPSPPAPGAQPAAGKNNFNLIVRVMRESRNRFLIFCFTPRRGRRRKISWRQFARGPFSIDNF